MKIIAIGDIHGRDLWKEIVKKHENEDCHFIFVGDYFDSFDINSVTQINNFKEIIDLKLKYPNSVTLLIGNHDYHYLPYINDKCSGFNNITKISANDIISYVDKNKLWQMSYQYKDFLFSHAGVSSVWCDNVGIDINDKENLSININTLFLTNPINFAFSSRYGNPYGDEVTQTPIWIRPDSLEKSAVPGFTHIVGHTERGKSISKYLNNYKKSIVIDRLYDREYLIIDNGKIIPSTF
jgi:hypothetical protein